MLRISSFVLAACLFVNIGLFVRWRKIKRLPQIIRAEAGGQSPAFSANSDDLKIVEPIAVTQSIAGLQMRWWNEAIRKYALKSIVDRDFPEESPILIAADEG